MTRDRSDDAKTVPAGRGRYLLGDDDGVTKVTRVAGVPDRDEASPSPGALSPGDLVDNFQVVRLLGRGGMGQVYLARDVKLGRKVALKLIQPGYLGAEGAAERFMTEARLTARFDHPHIIPVHGVGEHQGQPYLALAYLEGQTLRDRLRERRTGTQESIRFGLAIALALEEAHRHGVLHRDLKPANVFVGSDGRLRVLDFGLAKTVSSPPLDEVTADGPGPTSASPKSPVRRLETETEPATTTSGGTPSYMAPEQWTQGECTPATDMWALGVILFEMCSGRRPFEASDLVMLAVLVGGEETAPALERFADVPAGLATLVAECLAKAPEARPTAAKVRETLERLLGHARPAPGDGDSPFRGLLPFTERHADMFFGRDQEVAALTERLRLQPLVAVVGPSGAGKSSFVHAGVIPRLREQEPWIVLSMRPGNQPFSALAARMARHETYSSSTLASRRRAAEATVDPVELAEARSEEEDLAEALRSERGLLAIELRAMADRRQAQVLLLVDQLEELYTLTQDDEIRRAFMAAICSAADDPNDPVRVVFTVRDDFLGRLATSREAREALTQVTVLQRLGEAQLREILTKPVEALGYRYDDAAVVEHMIASVEAEPTSLPLLQFTAQRLWERRDDSKRLLLRRAYDDMGGVGGALGKHADGVLEGLSPAALKLARKLMLRLVTPERTRRVVPRARLIEALGPDLEPVLDRLVEARLLSVSRARGRAAQDATLELAHESLTRTWSTLSRWIDESDEEVAFLNEVVQAAELWEKRGRRPEELWRGDALRDAGRMRRQTQLTQLASEFLDAATRREAAAVLRKRAAVVTAIAALVAVAVVLAFQKRQLAEQTRVADERRAEALQQRAEALREGARAAFDRRQMLEARAKLRTALEIETRGASEEGTGDSSSLLRALWHQLKDEPLVWTAPFGAQPFGAAFSPDGQTVATSNQIGVIHLLDVRTRRARPLRGQDTRIFALAFSPDGATLASAGEDGSIWLWSPVDSTVRRKIAGDGKAIQEVAFSPDGKLLASAGRSSQLQLFDTSSGKEVGALEGHESWVYGVAFSPDGKRIASCGKDGSVRIWDTQSGKQLHELRGHRGWVMVVSFSPDGKQLASAGVDKDVHIWNTENGAEVRVLRGHRTMLFALGYSPDGKYLASSGHDPGIWLWPAAASDTPRVVGADSTGVSELTWSPDSKLLGAVMEDQAFRLWDVTTTTHAQARSGHGPGIMAAVLSPDGKRIASAGLDKAVRLWDADSGAELAVMNGHTEAIFDVAFSADGALVASASADRSVRLWDTSAGIEKSVLNGHGTKVMSLAFRPGSDQLVSAGADGRILVWDVAAGTPTGQLGQRGPMITDIAFPADGERLVSSAIDGSVTVWSIDDEKVLATLRRHGAPAWSVAFAGDGGRVALGGTDGKAQILDAESGTVLQSLGDQPGRMTSVAFSPDGARLATGSSDAHAFAWDLESGKAIPFAGPSFEINTVNYSPDGGRVVTAHDDGTVRLWDAATFQPLWRAPLLLRPHAGEDHPTLFSHLGWTRLKADNTSEPLKTGDGGNGPPMTEWRRALSDRARFASEAPRGDVLCLQTHTGQLELWDRASDKRLVEQFLPGLDQVVALADGCAARTQGKAGQPGAVLINRQGTRKELVTAARVSALAVTEEGLLVAAADEIRSFDHAGEPQGAARKVGSGVSAIVELSGGPDPILVLGYESGDLELWPVDPKRPRIELSFERVPASAAVSLALGPMRTVIAGFGNGVVGQWSLDDGNLLEQAKLHGPIWHLQLQQQTLYAASALGQHIAWDLSVFHADSCALLQQVWQQVPVVWEGGRAVVRDPPSDHPCVVAKP